jgi:hypothetical protein
MRQHTRPLAALATIITGVGVGAFALALPAHADTTTVTYLYSGTEQMFAVPAQVHSVHVDAVGGGGGSSLSDPSGTEAGGSGARMSADVPVTPSTNLYIEVGGDGEDGAGDHGVAGGWNGGGAGTFQFGAGGGGASDVRTSPSGPAASLGTRLLVAAGGGGAAYGGPGGTSGSSGGTADSSCGQPGGPGGGGGASSGGSGGSPVGGPPGSGEDGTFGVGGDGGGNDVSSGTIGGGGGGGGYYGGGGGGAAVNGTCAGGGGGGSSFLAPGVTFATPGADVSSRPSITISYVILVKPQVTTVPASDIATHGATLNGVITPETVGAQDSGALCHFEYGLTSGYGTSTPGGGCGSGTDQLYFWETLTGLDPGTTYHYRLAGSNARGYSYGADMSFTTAPAPPVPAPAPAVTTSPATNVGQHQATLNGLVNPRGSATNYHFVYGTTTSYGRSSPTLSAGSGSTNVSVHALLSGLVRHTTYHFRLVAVNGNGTARGVDRTFRTG